MILENGRITIETAEEGRGVCQAALLAHPFNGDNGFKGDGWRAHIYENVNPEHLPLRVAEDVSRNAIVGYLTLYLMVVEATQNLQTHP